MVFLARPPLGGNHGRGRRRIAREGKATVRDSGRWQQRTWSPGIRSLWLRADRATVPARRTAAVRGMRGRFLRDAFGAHSWAGAGRALSAAGLGDPIQLDERPRLTLTCDQ